jgi:hypothetical protein
MFILANALARSEEDAFEFTASLEELVAEFRLANSFAGYEEDAFELTASLEELVAEFRFPSLG